jgi:hypothetical protein
VRDNTVSSISKPEALHLGKKRLGFQLDSLRQLLSRTRSWDIGQGIIDLVGVTKPNMIAWNLKRTVSAISKRRAILNKRRLAELGPKANGK